ncbi:ion transporter, partial [Pseudomonadales bacterium]|nr:ion transporter [Pseudomonadales bacterium]
MSRSKLQNTLHDIIFGTESPLGKAFDICLIVAICISVLAVILDSVNLFNQRYDSLLLTLEWSFTILFTIEYIARLYCSPHPIIYARSFYGVVDILSIVPSY